MTLGTIGDYMMLINRYKADCMQTISRISADNSRTTEFKNEQIASCKELLNKDILSTNAKIKECIAEIRKFVGKPLTYHRIIITPLIISQLCTKRER